MGFIIALFYIFENPWILAVIGGLAIFAALLDVCIKHSEAKAIEQTLLEREEERARKRKEIEEARRLREQEREKQKEEQRRAADEKKRLREQEMSEQRRMAVEQRRLMKPSLRYEILTRDGFRCRICGASADDGVTLHVDHIIPVSKGGKTEKSNLRTLCERCNLGKGDKIESILVPSAAAPRAIPAQPVVPARPVVPESEEAFADIQNLSMNEAIQLLNAFGIRYVDNIDRGGCFWIELTQESEMLLHDKTIDGKKIHTANHSKAFSNAPALYVK